MMNKTWKYLMIIAIIMLVSYVAMEIYASITGQNVKFNKVVTAIENDLGSQVLDYIKSKDDDILVRDESLDNK